MAADSRDKRDSLIGRRTGIRTVLPLADGVVDAGDRLQFAGLYRGIAAAATADFIPRPSATVTLRDRPIASVQSE